MFAIFKREVMAYFYSPIAYVLIGLFILVTSLLFILINLNSQIADFNITLSYMGLILAVIVPILTMKILAEDRKSGTEVLLISSPVSLTAIVVGKYLASLFVFLVMNCISLIYPIILFSFGEPAVAQLIGGYAGFILLGAAFISIGLFASSLSENQVIAAIVSFVGILVMLFMQSIAGYFGGYVAKVLNWFSLLARYDDFNAGILNLSSIFYYFSFIVVFVFLTIRVIEKRRWSQG